MINPAGGVPTIDPGELLARYVLQSSHIRSSNGSVKPDAFIPHPWPDLSVTRHHSATQNEVWAVGQDVATQTNKKLYGRADLEANHCIAQNLSVVPDPLPNNPNHANIAGWPSGKPEQKMIAVELAAVARYVAAPNNVNSHQPSAVVQTPPINASTATQTPPVAGAGGVQDQPSRSSSYYDLD